jgi:hypothetical protein
LDEGVGVVAGLAGWPIVVVRNGLACYTTTTTNLF